ncbi:MAG: uncharacterized protein KVP18_004349 [Porospora cf. gigantea A]|uniref:uncharacterized protein n=1 Tax=Porospora cf. gigantea A TaxID=2853593 RepID=UPI00355A70F0|nr:MAG: hypothetical protein KVP18_004349 [Porospora cf. gigantea A]
MLRCLLLVSVFAAAKEGEVWGLKEAKDYQTRLTQKLKDNPQLTKMAASPRGDIASAFCDVKYCVPSELSDGFSSLTASIGAHIRQIEWPAIGDVFGMVSKVDLDGLSAGVPFVEMVSDLFEQACGPLNINALIANAGKSKEDLSYPYCLVNYLKGVHAFETAARVSDGVMRQYGELLRDLFNHEGMIRDVTLDKGNVCQPVVELLGLPSKTCQDLYDMMLAASYAQRLAVDVNAQEKQAHGEAASMLEMSALAPDKLRRLHSLRARIAMVSAYDGFCLQLFREESRHLAQHWYNDPIHKWRYGAGLVNYFVHLGVFLGRGQAALRVGHTSPPPQAEHVKKLLGKGVKQDYQHVAMGNLVK